MNQITFSIVLTVCLVCSVYADTYTAPVIDVIDGDTIKVLVDKHQIKIRLHGIDAPERKQPYNRASTKFLKEILCNPVTVDARTTDRYGRTIAVLNCGMVDINSQMVKSGYAWAYRRYSSDYIQDEELAKSARVGLWQDENPMPPWEFRRR